MTQLDLIGDEILGTVRLGERTFGWGTSAQLPVANFHANGWFIATDTGIIYQNQGTEATPSWVAIVEGSNTGLILALGD